MTDADKLNLKKYDIELSQVEELTPENFDKLIRGKNINFLIGAGASSSMYPTLSFGDDYPTFEDIVSHNDLNYSARVLMYMYYFKNWIEPMSLEREKFNKEYGSNDSIKFYRNFIILLYSFLQNESNESPKRINIFTTNYDLVLERIFDDFLVDNPLIYFNDGSRGFFQKYINNKNFYLNVTHSGYNDNFRREVPTINLFKLHGSISWLIEKGKENQERIIVSEHNYYITKIRDFLNKMNLSLEDFRDIFNSSLSKEIGNVISNLNKQVAALNIDERKWREFYDKYTNLSIINPDKYKFSKTVLEQHYYQLIRSFSYELEKKQSVLIVFGFSFADEHIRDIFERSLLNPELLVILISYSASGQQQMKKMYEGYSNIIFLPLDFNEQIGDFKYLLYLLGDSNAK